MRTGPRATLPGLLLAAGMLIAAKPLPPAPVEGPEQARELWRGTGISLCVAELRAIPEFSPDDLERICGCGVDSYLERIGSTPAAPLARGSFPAALRSRVISCTAQTRPERMSDVARLTMNVPQTAPPPAVAPPVMETPPLGDKPAADESPVEAEDSSGGLFDWFRNLAWPAWLTGASVLWWIALGIFVFGLLVLKIRRRDPRNDLVGPPSHMRRGATPQPPRRPDLPR